MKDKLIIYGAGEFGSLILNLVQYHPEISIVAYGDDNPKFENSNIDGKPIYSFKNLLKFSEKNNITNAISAIGNNVIRAEKFKKLKENGFKMISLVHPKALIDTKVKFGENVIIEMGTALHTNSTIGNNVFLGGDALIGHHNKIGNHVLIGGNVSLGGSVVIEDFASIGVGASIKPGVRIGKGAVVGVGSVVINDVDPNSIVVGVPAKPINGNDKKTHKK